MKTTEVITKIPKTKILIAFSLKLHYNRKMIKNLTPKSSGNGDQNLLKTVLKEIRLLRQEFFLLFPSEDILDYKHPDRIVESYKDAVKEYPPMSL